MHIRFNIFNIALLLGHMFKLLSDLHIFIWIQIQMFEKHTNISLRHMRTYQNPGNFGIWLRISWTSSNLFQPKYGTNI